LVATFSGTRVRQRHSTRLSEQDLAIKGG
jgi:hypothetical protein